LVRLDQDVHHIGAMVHCWTEHADQSLPHEMMLIGAEHLDREWDDLVLARTACAFLALVTRQSVRRPRSDLRVMMGEVVDEVGHTGTVQVVIEDDAAPDPYLGVGVVQSAAQCIDGCTAHEHEVVAGALRAVGDTEVFDELVE
jgi:hypothetical protein